MTRSQQATIDHNRAHIAALKARMAAANTAAPAGFEATCPKCGEPSNASLIANWGHCMACQRAGWAQRVAGAEAATRG